MYITDEVVACGRAALLRRRFQGMAWFFEAIDWFHKVYRVFLSVLSKKWVEKKKF
jgi:hypothetical protein